MQDIESEKTDLEEKINRNMDELCEVEKYVKFLIRRVQEKVCEKETETDNLLKRVEILNTYLQNREISDDPNLKRKRSE